MKGDITNVVVELTLKINYTSSHVNVKDIDESTLRLHHWDGSEWDFMQSTIDTSQNTITFLVQGTKDGISNVRLGTFSIRGNQSDDELPQIGVDHGRSRSHIEKSQVIEEVAQEEVVDEIVEIPQEENTNEQAQENNQQDNNNNNDNERKDLDNIHFDTIDYEGRPPNSSEPIALGLPTLDALKAVVVVYSYLFEEFIFDSFCLFINLALFLLFLIIIIICILEHRKEKKQRNMLVIDFMELIIECGVDLWDYEKQWKNYYGRVSEIPSEDE